MLKKIGIITFLHNENYGSSLQAYALQRVLRNLGYDAEHLDYQPDRLEKIRNLLTSGNSPKLVLEGLRKRGVQADQAGARAKKEAIRAFYAREMRLSPPCGNREALKRVSSRYDLLLCGSDQIWNPVWLNPAYFLDFADRGKRKLAYAPSLGVTTLEDRRKREKIRRLTADFEALSVREAEGARLLKDITGRDADVLPDPVCLLSLEEWREVAGSATLSSIRREGGHEAAPEMADGSRETRSGALEDGAWVTDRNAKNGARTRVYDRPENTVPAGNPTCLLCYFIGENPAYWERVRSLAAETGLPVRVIPVTAESYASGFELLDGLGPEGFLGAVSGAACLCTDSFHGLVFGTLFGVRTELLRRYSDADPESKNSRVDHFLRQMRESTPEDLRQQGLRWLQIHIG